MLDLATIGIAMDTSGLEKGVRALGEAEKSANKAATAADKVGKASTGAASSYESMRAAVDKLTSQETKHIQKLVDEYQQMGMNRGQMEAYRAAQSGMSKGAQELAAAVGAKIEAHKREQAAMEASSRGMEGLASAGRMVAGAMAAIGVSVSVREFLKLADASTNVASRLGLVTNSASELALVQQRLFGIAQNARVSFVDLAGTYAQLARSTKDLGVSQDSLLGVVKTVSQAVTISGGSAESARAALTQLSQGFAAGALRGDELNSVLEQTPRLAQAIADGLGVSIGKLRALGAAGELTAEKVLGALEKSAASVSTEFGKMAMTVEQASTQASNSVLKLVGAIDQLTGTSKTVSGAISAISKGIDLFAQDILKLGSQGPLRAAAREVINLDAEAKRFRTGMQSGVFGPNAQGQLDRINAQLDAAKQKFRALNQELGGAKDPRDQSGYTSRGTSYANESKRQEKLTEDLNNFRLKQAGVPTSYIKDMAELIRLNQAGVLVGNEYTVALKKQQDVLLKKTGAVKSSNAAANQEQNTYESLIASIRGKIEADNLELSGGAALTESQRIRIKLDQDLAAGRIKLGSAYQVAIRAAIEDLSVSEAEVAGKKAIEKANLSAAAAREKYIASLDTGLEKIQADIAAQNEATARMGLSKEAIAALDAAKLEMLATDLELQAIKAMDRNLDEQTYNALKKQAQAYRDLAKAKQAGAAKETALDIAKADADAAKKAADEWQKTADSINQSLTDALMRGFESGKDFAKNMRDTVVNMFKTMVLRPVISFILSPISMALGGLFGGMGGAMAGQGGGGGILGMAANGASMYNGLTSGTGMLGTVGNWLGLGATGGAVGAGAWGSAAVAGSYAAPGIGAVGSLGGAGASTGIMGALGAIPGWGWALAGLALLGPSLFGHTLKDSGIQGTFGGDKGFEGNSYKYYEGGLFSSDKTDIGALDETVRKTLGDTFNAMKTQVTDFATALGLSTDKLKGYTSDVKISLKGLSDADAQKKIQDALATANNDLAQQVIGTWVTTTQDVVRQVQNTAAAMEAGAGATSSVTSSETTSVYKPSEFAHEGEKAIDTLKRLATSLETANTWLTRFGAKLFDASLSGGSQASDFIDKTGGQDAFNSQASSYFNNYYTSAQKYQAAQDEIAKKLNDAGVAMPHTAAEFKAAMDQFLAMGVAGQDGAAALLGVNDAFAQIHGTIGQLEQAMGVSADSLKSILDDVRKGAATPAEASKRFEDSIYSGLGSAMTQGLSQMIMNAVVGPLVNGLLAGATGSAAALTAGGVAGGSSSAVGGAAAGGAVASGGAAAGAAMAQGGAMAGAAVASTIDQARTYMAGFAEIMADPTVRDTIGKIAAGFGDIAASMPGLTGGASSVSSAMSSAGSSAGGMSSAVSQLGDTLDAEVKRLRGLMVTDSTNSAVSSAVLMAQFATDTAKARAGDQTALAALAGLSQQIEAQAQLTATSSVDLARTRGWLAGSLEQTQADAGTKSYAPESAADMTSPGYDIRDMPTYSSSYGATPVYHPWEEATVDSRYANSWSTTPLAGTGNLRGTDPNAMPDIRYTGGGIDAVQYDARDPNYRPDWRYSDSWSADPHLVNPRPTWYGPAYEQGTPYVPNDGLAYLHEGEAVVPAAYNKSNAGQDSAVLQELRALRSEVTSLRTQQASNHLDAQRLRLRPAKTLERWEQGGLPTARQDGVIV